MHTDMKNARPVLFFCLSFAFFSADSVSNSIKLNIAFCGCYFFYLFSTLFIYVNGFASAATAAPLTYKTAVLFGKQAAQGFPLRGLFYIMYVCSLFIPCMGAVPIYILNYLLPNDKQVLCNLLPRI